MKMQRPQDELIEEIQETLLEIGNKTNINLDKVILFGSIAKGKQDKNSDIDIIVISNDWTTGDLSGRSAPISRKIPYDWPHVDIICRTPQEMKKPIDTKKTIENLEKNGITIIKNSKKTKQKPNLTKKD